MKLIEKMAEEFNKKITTHYLHGGIGDLPDTVEKVWMAGFRAARKWATELADQSSVHCQCAIEIEDMGEQEVPNDPDGGGK